ncbi:MAG: glycosyltransferase family 4 protein [Hyphomicrobiales bacterium]|nr:glycosyltransferase family 4 protein [Hyphomicrobiales bacterium]
MKIAFINTLYTPQSVGGAERSVQSLAEHLAGEGHDVIVCCTTPEANGRVGQVNGVKVYYVPLENLYWPFDDRTRPFLTKAMWHLTDCRNGVMARAVTQILEQEQVDVANTNNLFGFSSSVLDGVRALGLPHVHTLRDHYFMCSRSVMYKNGKLCGRTCLSCFPISRVKKYALRRSQAVVGISQYILDRHISAGFVGRDSLTRVIPNSYQAKSGGVRTRERPGPGEGLRLGYLGRLYQGKGIEQLLESISRRSDATELHVAGAGEPAYVAYLQSRFASPKIHFLGQCETARFLDVIDVLVAPSFVPEAFGRTIVEAMAHEVPVIASNRGGMPELIDDGRDGFIYDANDPGALDRMVDHVVANHDLLDGMAQVAAAKVSRFLPATIAAEYLSLYEELIARQDNTRALG